MSEYINNRDKRLENLLQFSLGMINGEDGTVLIEKYGDAISHITPHDMIEMEEKQLTMGVKVGAIKSKIENVMNVIYDQLKAYEWKQPEEGHALFYLMQENRELEKVLETMKADLKIRDYKEFSKHAEQLYEIENHYVRKENILFPYLERSWNHCRPLTVMWSIHDDIRLKIKQLFNILDSKSDFDHELYVIIGDLFFLLYGMIAKEELVIYPVAMETIENHVWNKIHKQSFEIGFSYIPTPPKHIIDFGHQPELTEKIFDAVFKCETGSLNQEQLEMILDALPLDLSFIDHNDEVRYFSNPKDRFFPRSPAIIGRKVQNCHPPESVHIVEKILKAFRAKKRDEASFWIQMRGKFILIKYFAIRSSEGKYLGCLEVGQDITEIRNIEGECRLLDWE